MEITEEKRSAFETEHNLQNIARIHATHTGDVERVLNTVRQCESIFLTEDQFRMASDISSTIVENNPFGGKSAAYLVRYGILLEREGLATEGTSADSK